MGLEVAVRFTKPPLQSEVEKQLSAVEGMVANGDRGYRWENEEIDGFFTIDLVPLEKRGLLGKGKPKLAGLDITVPWGGPAEEIELLAQILDALAEKSDLTGTSPVVGTPMSKGGFGALEPAWHRANVEALIAYANQDEMSIRHRRERSDDDDPERVEILDATQMSVDSDQREVYQANCGMRVAQAFQRCGEHKLAIVTAHRVIQRVPDESFAHILLGISFNALGDNDTAIRVYQRAIDVRPDGQNVDYAKSMIEQLGGTPS
jgi:tetratricopeptide (TPR) repeat protein